MKDNLSHIEEERLWERFKEGDSEALGLLSRRHYRALFNYAIKFTKDREVVKDCIQDLFLELWERRDYLTQTPFVRIYLIKALRNNLFRKIRQEKKFTDAEDLDSEIPLSDHISAESSWIESELFLENEEKIKTALSKLPKRQQEIIFLKFYENLSNDQISEILDMNRQSVANLLHRALTSLKTNWFSVAKLLLLFWK
ncbi:MAG: RNA polymerase sigma factor [Runella zeae]